MPREKIKDLSTTGWYTEVSWRRRPGLDTDDQGTAPGHVQIASVNALSPFYFPDIETDGHFEAGEKFDGWRVTLDEAGIDRLIKTLHKAKRQAYGGDVTRTGPMRDVDGEVLTSLPTMDPPGSYRVTGDPNVVAAERGAYLPGPDGGRYA